MLPFVHFRVHSDYSMSHGASKVKDLVKRAKALGQPAIALADEEALHGAMELSKYAEAEGVQPILATKVYMPTSKKGTTKGSLILLAQTQRGYANVCRLLNMDLAPGRPRANVLDKDAMRLVKASLGTDDDMVADVLCLAGSGADSLLGACVRDGGAENADAVAGFLASVFGDRFYVEICRNGHPDDAEVEVETQVLAIAADRGLSIVGTTEVCYATPDRHDAYAILRAVAEGRKGGITCTRDGLHHADPKRKYLRSSEEMWELFEDLQEAFVAPIYIAQRCAVKATKRKPLLPPYQSAEGRTEGEELRLQARTGLEERLALAEVEDRTPYLERLEFELDVIENMGFPGYFLIVADFIKYAKSRDIPVGPGRGSGAGSVVAWALTITDLDPLRFGLLFERFLNPERVSMPDFDIDFCEAGRAEVIRYVEEKYTRDRVAGIATFAEIKSKSGLRDVGRVLVHAADGGLSQMEINNIANMVPGPKNGVELKLKEVFDQVPEFADLVTGNVRAMAVYENTLKTEGLFRQAGAHAAGIIIAGDKLTNLVPVGFDPKTGFPVVQLNMKDAESAGLVKFDFLGLTTLSVIKEALGHVREVEGVDVDISAIPLDDKGTLDLFAQGRTTGIFQFESEGMKRALKDVKADRIEDLIAVNALYRPGPMDFIPTYAACKNGRQDPKYPEPVEKTKPFLEETFGIMVYQEQVMQVAQASAGYSLGGADLLRRAMGKKIKAEMDAQKSTFVKGCMETNGLSENAAKALFENIEAFANYGFNKSHAAAYSVVAFQTGYLKAHHRVSFFAALLSYETDNAERMALIKQDMDLFGLKFLLPDVNHSFARFRPERRPDGSIGLRFGLAAIKGVSPASVDPMVREREANGPFQSLEEFHARAGGLFNSGQLQKLAEAGAFDALTPEANRQRAFEVLNFLAKNDRRDTTTIDLFGGNGKVTIRRDILDLSDWTDLEDREFAAVGFFLRQHPLEQLGTKVFQRGVERRQAIVEWMAKGGLTELGGKKLFGMVEKVDVRHGRRGIFHRVKIAERQDTYWVNLFTDDTGTTTKMLDAAVKNREPIVLTASFSPGNAGPQDFYIQATAVCTANEHIDRNPAPMDWEIVLDPRKSDMPPPTREAIEVVDAKAAAADPKDYTFGDQCLHEAQILLGDTTDALVSTIKHKLLGRKSADTQLRDTVHLEIKMRAGVFRKNYLFEFKIPPITHEQINNELGPTDGVENVRSRLGGANGRM